MGEEGGGATTTLLCASFSFQRDRLWFCWNSWASRKGDGLNVELYTNTQFPQQDKHRDLLNDLNTEVCIMTSTTLQPFINNDFLDRDPLTLNHFNNLTL